MENKDVLMILPKKTVHVPSDLDSSWDVDKDGAGITLYSGSDFLGHAMWMDGDEFGFERPSVMIVTPAENEDLDPTVFEALISRLALAYEMMPRRYPLYIRLQKDRLSDIAAASRMGFIPYFGTWQSRSSDESQSDWQEVTDALRQQYPKGLQA